MGAALSTEEQFQCSKNCLILPLLPFEHTWNQYFRAILYGMALIYFFMGVAILSDIFMSSIETIVNKKRHRDVTLGEGEDKVVIQVETAVWNSTVANLTLMALGSSAPEILLSVIEICGNDFKSGELGPGTIVGSAAFNLLFITAVCILFVPDGEIRRIEIYRVFIVTSIFSVFAYLWMVIVLELVSYNEVEIWEAVITLLCFPGLVSIAYWAEQKFCFKGRPVRKSLVDKAMDIRRIQEGKDLSVIGSSESGLLTTQEHPLYLNGQVNPTAVLDFYKTIRQFADVTDDEIAALLAAKLIESQEHSRLWYRIGAVRGLMGGSKLQPVLNEKLQQVYDVINDHKRETTGRRGVLRVIPTSPDLFQQKAVFEFQCASLAVPESIGILTVVVIRSGRADIECSIKVQTIEGTAKAKMDFEALEEVLVFEPFVYERNVSVKIIDDNQWEPEESFFLRLSMAAANEDAILGQTHTMEITIIDDDLPGSFCFSKRGYIAKEGVKEVPVEIEREAGSDGVVSTKWRTFPDTSIQPMKMPQSIEGTITFQHGERKKIVMIPLIVGHNESIPKDETFDVEMYEPTGGAKIGKTPRCSVTISNDGNLSNKIETLMDLASKDMEAASPASSYGEQIKGAFSVNGGKLDEAEKIDFILHFFTFFWKILFSLIPPPYIGGGWPCFFLSLTAIGVLTAIIGDLASIFGCLIGLHDTITAITFVALGTSLPDTFASMAAAKGDRNADNAIGNVTGSNSVNVFLGLGVPWTIAAIYHKCNGNIFEVKAGDLVFSVIVYTVVATLALSLLILRRYSRIWGAAELGGPKTTKYLSAGVLILLWFLYVGLSTAQAYGPIVKIGNH